MRRNKILCLVAMFFSVLALSFVGLCVSPKTASAETASEDSATTVSTTVIEGSEVSFRMGASVRIDTSGAKTSGLRFVANFSEDFYTTITSNGDELGMIIVPESYVTDYKAQTEYTDYLTYFANVKNKAADAISRKFATSKMISVSDGREIRGALVVAEVNYTRTFQAIAYCKVGETYHYFTPSDARSVSQVSMSAIQEEPITDGVGIYTDEELGVLYGYVGGAIPRVIYDGDKTAHADNFQATSGETTTTPTVENGTFVFTENGSYAVTKNGLDDIVNKTITYNKIILKATVTDASATNGVTIGWRDADGNALGSATTITTGNSATISITQDQFISAVSLQIDGLSGGTLVFESVVAMGDVDYSNLTYDQIDYTQIDNAEDFQVAVGVLLTAVDAAGGVTQENAAKIIEAYEANGGLVENKNDLSAGDNVSLMLYSLQARYV